MIGYIGQDRECSKLYPSKEIGQDDGQSEVTIKVRCEVCDSIIPKGTTHHCGIIPRVVKKPAA